MLLLEKADVGMRAIDFTPANLYPAHAHNEGAEYKLPPSSTRQTRSMPASVLVRLPGPTSRTCPSTS